MLPKIPIPETPSKRPSTVAASLNEPFVLGPANKSYKHQFANLYFVRLLKLRKCVEERAAGKWSSLAGKPTAASGVLDVVKGQLCYIIGTVYMEMPLKPNVLDDIGKEHGIPEPLGTKIFSAEDKILLEDESGRIRLVGDALQKFHLVTGIIIAALGAENASGEFEVVDVCFPGIAPRMSVTDSTARDNMDIDDDKSEGAWVALVSGLDVGGQSLTDLSLQLMVEFLLGEGGGEEEQSTSSRISRLIVVGNSLAPLDPEDDERLVSSTKVLAGHLSELCRSLPVHLMPGSSDPTGATLPQQPVPPAVFGEVHKYPGFHSETNPAWITIDNCSILAASGQTLDDIFKYTASEDRLAMARHTLQWRHMAPTAPDTLWCYPYFAKDPFVIEHSPHVYAIGNQPSFETDVVEDQAGLPTRIILLPKFSDTGTVILLNIRSLAVKSVVFEVTGWKH